MGILTVLIPLAFGAFFMWVYLTARVKSLNQGSALPGYRLPPLWGK